MSNIVKGDLFFMNTDKFKDKIILCEKSNLKKNEIFEMHSHDYIEMEVILKGEAEHICNSDATIVKHGHCYIITPHDFHAFHPKTDVELLNIHFDLNILDEEIINVLSLITYKNFYCQFADDGLKRICRNIDIIQKEQSDKLPLSNTISKALIHEIIVDIIRASGNNINHIPTLAQKVISYVHTNFRNNISLSDISEHFLCTPNYIGKVFTKHTGVSFNYYLNQIRLKYVCNMLRFSNLSIKKIAIMSGYSSVEYFFYIFKKYMGITPLDYKKQESIN